MEWWRQVPRLGAVVVATLAAACSPDGGAEANAASGTAGARGIIADSYAEIPDVFGHGVAENTSDPEAVVIGSTLYVYTSSDRGWGKGGDGSIYPMSTTYVHALGAGTDPANPDNWNSAAVWSEGQLDWVEHGQNPDGTWGTNHLWAPGVFKKGSQVYLMIPDVEQNDPAQSHIGVATSTSPSGGFSYLGRFDIAGYASDPSVAGDPAGNRYLVWANGDWSTPGVACGGISLGKLDPSNPLKVVNKGEIEIQGIPYPHNQECIDRYAGRSVRLRRPYLEGPSLYYWGGNYASPPIVPGATRGDGPWYLVFSMVHDGPKIAYARSRDLKTWKYQGVIMDADANHELTNQASIVKWGNDWLLFYHDGPPGVDVDHKRQVHAECITFDADGRIYGMDYNTGAPTEQTLLRTTVGLQCARRWPGSGR